MLVLTRRIGEQLVITATSSSPWAASTETRFVLASKLPGPSLWTAQKFICVGLQNKPTTRGRASNPIAFWLVRSDCCLTSLLDNIPEKKPWGRFPPWSVRERVNDTCGPELFDLLAFQG